jgi:hypothetical protein
MFARVSAVFIALVMTVSLSAAELVMDSLVPSTTERIAAGTYSTVLLLNTLPFRTYTIDTNVQAHEIPLVDLAAEVKKAKDAQEALAVTSSVVAPECGPLKAAVDALLVATDEKQVPQLAFNLKQARAKAAGKDCVDEDLATAVFDRTSRSFSTNLVLEKGKFVTVTAYRIEDDATKTKIAEKIFDTGETGAVRTHLLLGMHPNKDEKWFAKETGTNPAEYTITREADRDSADPFGAALFTWLPAENTSGWTQIVSFRRGDVSGSFAAGLGFDSADPVYLFGYAFNITESFGVAAGVAGFNQQRLKGIYKGDGAEKVSTNLQPDQLVEDTFGTGWFVGLTIRR